MVVVAPIKDNQSWLGGGCGNKSKRKRVFCIVTRGGVCLCGMKWIVLVSSGRDRGLCFVFSVRPKEELHQRGEIPVRKYFMLFPISEYSWMLRRWDRCGGKRMLCVTRPT